MQLFYFILLGNTKCFQQMIATFPTTPVAYYVIKFCGKLQNALNIFIIYGLQTTVLYVRAIRGAKKHCSVLQHQIPFYFPFIPS